MWHAYEGGASIGQLGSEGGVIEFDEEHAGGARITLERGGHAPWSITCGVYGSMVHTRFFSDRDEAATDLEPMKLALAEVLGSDHGDRFSAFIDGFP